MPYQSLLDFHLRREYISQNLCENLDKGITSCRGSCYLEKKIEDERQNPEGSTVYTRHVHEFKALYLLTPGWIEEVLVEDDHGYGCRYPQAYHFQFVSNIFHPPKALCDTHHTTA
jgi:hypothetical protein